MKKKQRCPTCGKKMHWRIENSGYVCLRCGYPDTAAIVAWQKRHKATKKPRNVFRIIIDKITGKKMLMKKKEE